MINQNQLFVSDNENRSSQYNFNYKLDLEKEGHNIELEADFNTFGNDELGDFNFTGASDIPNYEDLVDTERDRITINLDYVNPLSETTKLELGLEARLFNSDIGRISNQEVVNPFNNLSGFIVSPSTQFDYSRDIPRPMGK